MIFKQYDLEMNYAYFILRNIVGRFLFILDVQSTFSGLLLFVNFLLPPRNTLFSYRKYVPNVNTYCIFFSDLAGVRRECKICGKVLSDLWKHMRTVHGQYRRKVKIPKDEVFVSPSNSTAAPLPTVAVTTSISDKTFEQINSSSPELPDMLPLSDMQTKPSQNGLSLELSFELTQPIPVLPVVPLPPLKISPQLPTKNSTKTPQPKIGSASPNKRKSSSPLKVKMPFKTKLRN